MKTDERKPLKVGLVGIGGMGYCHYCCYDNVADAKVVAVCDVRDEMARETVKNHAEKKGETALPVVYADLDEMLKNEELDVLDVCTPSYLHAEMAIKGLTSGLNVLCEKPMALKFDDARRMVEAAENSGKKLMVAHVVRFMRPYVYLKEAIESERLGKLLRLDMKRISQFPTREFDNWMADENLSGGVGLDLSVHDLDLALFALGNPDEIHSFYRPIDESENNYIVSELVYKREGGLNATVTCEGGWYHTAIPFRSDYLAVFENGYIRFEDWAITENGETVDASKKGAITEGKGALFGDDAYTSEIAYFVDCVLSDRPVEYITPASSANTVDVARTTIDSAVVVK